MNRFDAEQVQRLAPRLAQRKWASPIADERWRGRNRIGASSVPQAWGRFLGRIPWEYFVTLTFDPRRCHRTSADAASREAFWWCGLVGRVMRKPVGWAYAIEKGRGGRWHAHALVIGTGDEPWTAPMATWEQRNGRIELSSVYDAPRVALYTSKAASGDEVVLSDTLARFRDVMAAEMTVRLYLCDR